MTSVSYRVDSNQAALSSSDSESIRPKRILLGHLGANGDCLFATAIARQIKKDFPGCHLTWAVGTAFRSILIGNPFVDNIWEVPVSNNQELWEKWGQFEKEARVLKAAGEFDEVFLTQIPPNNFKNFDGTVRASIFRGYPMPITESVTPIIRLLPQEVANVQHFAGTHHLSDYKHVILFECSSNSDQSFITPSFSIDVAQQLVELIPNVCVILSSNMPLATTNARLIDGSTLSLRENAELTKYCTLLVGGSSGISWICTSDWAKPLPMVQLLSKYHSVYASFVHDYEYRGEATDAILEMTDCSRDKVLNCLVTIITSGFESAKLSFHERIPVRFDFYISVIYNHLLKQGKFKDLFISLRYTIGRYGLHPQLLLCILRNLGKHVLHLFVKVEMNKQNEK